MNTRRSLIHIVSSNKWGGVQTYALGICRHYAEAGWEVTALTRNAVGVDAPFAEAGIGLLHAPVGGFFDLASPMTLARKLRESPRGATVVHTHRYRDAFTALLAKKIANRPDVRIVTTRHSVRRGRDTRVFRKIYSGISAHIFVSEMCYNAFRHSLKKDITLPPERIHILRNSINAETDTPLPEPGHGPVVALYQGALVRGKGLETLIDAMSLLKGTRLRLRISGMGNPDYLDMLRRRATQRDVMENIDWNSKTASTQEACAEAHFGVVPSTDTEACSLESLRFMAAARPQVATSNGAQKEYLENGRNSLLVDPGDAASLAEAMRTLALDSTLRTRLGKEAYDDYSRHLSWHHFIDSLNKIYTE